MDGSKYLLPNPRAFGVIWLSSFRRNDLWVFSVVSKKYLAGRNFILCRKNTFLTKFAFIPHVAIANWTEKIKAT